MPESLPSAESRVTFDTKEDLEIYDHHPEHEKARAYIKAHRTATATVDFEF